MLIALLGGVSFTLFARTILGHFTWLVGGRTRSKRLVDAALEAVRAAMTDVVSASVLRLRPFLEPSREPDGELPAPPSFRETISAHSRHVTVGRSLQPPLRCADTPRKPDSWKLFT